MKRLPGIALCFIVLMIFAAGCSKANPTSPAPQATATQIPTATATQTGLFVEDASIIQTQSSQGVGNAYATVILRYGNSTGAYVSGATVTIGSYTFTESPAGVYKATIANIADGQAISLSINSLAGNATSSINAPWSAEITNPSTDGTNQSAAATRRIDWRYWIITAGTYPQKVQILVWRSSDNTIYYNSEYTPSANGEYITLPANTLPTMGQVYFRAFGINRGTIVGSNGGSAMFAMYNSENTHYVNMVP